MTVGSCPTVRVTVGVRGPEKGFARPHPVATLGRQIEQTQDSLCTPASRASYAMADKPRAVGEQGRDAARGDPPDERKAPVRDDAIAAVRAAGPAERMITSTRSIVRSVPPGNSRSAVSQVRGRRQGVSRAALARGLQFGCTLPDAVLVGDRMPARRAALAGPADPAGGLQVPEQPEHLIAIATRLLGDRLRLQEARSVAYPGVRRERSRRDPDLRPAQAREPPPPDASLPASGLRALLLMCARAQAARAAHAALSPPPQSHTHACARARDSDVYAYSRVNSDGRPMPPAHSTVARCAP